MDRLFQKQLERSRKPDGGIDLDKLGSQVTIAYREAEEDRHRTERSIELMIEELNDLNDDLEREVERRTSELRQKRAELEIQNNRFNAALTYMTHGLAMFDKHANLVICNNRWKEMYKLGDDFVTPGRPFADVVAAIAGNGALSEQYSDPQDYVDHVRDRIGSGESSFSKLSIRDGRTIAINWQPMNDGGWVSIHEDITEREKTEQRLAHLARHDALTNLPNRTVLLGSLSSELSERDETRQVAVLYLDLDRFKSINDTLGHTIGDGLLQAVAKRLVECVNRRDTVARLGGDEFAIVQANIVDRSEAAILARRICKAINKPYDLDGHTLKIDVSVGIAVGPEDGLEPSELLRNADFALQRAKSHGNGAFRFFEPEMDALLKTRREFEVDLRRACESNKEQFEVFFQPIVNIAQNRVSSCEALVRWRHPEKGLVPPGDFIPVAEEIGVIGVIGEWVLSEACRYAATWPESVKVSVNVSPTQLASGNLVPQIIENLRLTRIAPERLEIEITEEMLVLNPEIAAKTLKMLNNIDCNIALDDFGTGYSSLIYLCRYPFDKIKIDKSFIANLPGRESAAIISAITGLARNLDMISTAEGIETADQLKQVQALGCTEVQGYLVSKPVPADEMTRMLNQQTAASSAVA